MYNFVVNNTNKITNLTETCKILGTNKEENNQIIVYNLTTLCLSLQYKQRVKQ